MKKKPFLLVVDVQNDFCSGGSLEVKQGEEVVPVINSLMPEFESVVATQDWHPGNHQSFASSHPGKKPMDRILLNGIEQILWPDHCVQNSLGSCFYMGLKTEYFKMIIRKGTNPFIDSYSAFQENDRKTVTGLEGYLKSLDITELFVCGLATDFCVYFTAMDGLECGFEVNIVLDASRGIDFPAGSLQKKLENFRKKGGRIINSSFIK